MHHNAPHMLTAAEEKFANAQKALEIAQAEMDTASKYLAHAQNEMGLVPTGKSGRQSQALNLPAVTKQEFVAPAPDEPPVEVHAETLGTGLVDNQAAPVSQEGGE